MALDAIEVLNVASTILAGSTALLVALGIRNLRGAKHGDTLSCVSETSADAKVGDQLRVVLKEQVRLEHRPLLRIPLLWPRKLVEDEKLTQAAADIGVADLEVLLRALMRATSRTPHLVGVNKGGSLVANFLAHRLSLHEKYLIKCDYRAEFSKLYCEDRDMVPGDIVVIDDVVRTGRTISMVKNYFRDKFPDSTIFAVCLVYVGVPDDDENSATVVDYHAWYATSRHITMPWSSRDDSETSAVFNDREIAQIVGDPQSSPVLNTQPRLTATTTD